MKKRKKGRKEKKETGDEGDCGTVDAGKEMSYAMQVEPYPGSESVKKYRRTVQEAIGWSDMTLREARDPPSGARPHPTVRPADSDSEASTK
jgi:hypothetical protein